MKKLVYYLTIAFTCSLFLLATYSGFLFTGFNQLSSTQINMVVFLNIIIGLLLVGSIYLAIKELK